MKEPLADVRRSSRPVPQLRSRASSGSDVQQQHGRVSRGSPLRPPRSATTAGAMLDAEEGCVRLEWSAYQAMVQDIMTLKTNLLKLKRVLQEAEVRNPFDSSLKQNGLYYSLAHSEGLEKREDGEEGREDPSMREENADLRRQVVFLQQQMSDKDRTIHLLQQQMSKYCSAGPIPPPSTTGDGPAELAAAMSIPTSNAATQTERVRPLSTGASISQSYPSEGGPLVSSNESLRRRSASSVTKGSLLPPPPCAAATTVAAAVAAVKAAAVRKPTPPESCRLPTKVSGLPRKIPSSLPKPQS